jgi:hypothetical protein
MNLFPMLGLLLLGAAAGAVPTAIWYSGHIREIRNLMSQASASDTHANGSAARANTRRSTRLARAIPVVLIGVGSNQNFQQQCETSVVNAHGCGLIVHEHLQRGTPILVKLIETGATREATVVLVTSIEPGSWLVGLEFYEPGNFWGIVDPPADWTG